VCKLYTDSLKSAVSAHSVYDVITELLITDHGIVDTAGSLQASSDSSAVSERPRTTVSVLEHCIPVSSADTRRHVRSANRHLLVVPRFPLNTYGRRAFSVAGPMAWNSLPGFIRDPTSSTDCFRRLLITYLFARYYCIQRIRGS